MASVSEYIAQGRTFLDEVVTELKKVYWPPRSETFAFTAVVMVVVVFTAVYLGMCDWILSLFMKFVF